MDSVEIRSSKTRGVITVKAPGLPPSDSEETTRKAGCLLTRALYLSFKNPFYNYPSKGSDVRTDVDGDRKMDRRAFFLGIEI